MVLVVDGLDEADAPGEGLPFGLPSLLPDGVYVVGTYRTGRSPGRPDAPVATVRIAKEDQRNQRDIRSTSPRPWAKTSWRPGWPKPVRTRRSSSACWPGAATGCGSICGMCLDELRFGLRRPDEISDLPSGLRNYYADQIRRWQHDSAWDTGLLPLLATLGVAGEPLPAGIAGPAGRRTSTQSPCGVGVT